VTASTYRTAPFLPAGNSADGHSRGSTVHSKTPLDRASDEALAMHLTQFRISACLTAILYLGVAFAYLCATSHHGIWEQALFTLTFTLIAGSCVVASSRRGESRLCWIGFAIFAGAYFILECCLPDIPRPRLLGTVVLRELYEHVAYLLGPSYDDLPRFVVCGHMLFAIIFGFVGAVLGSSVRPRDASQTHTRANQNGGHP